VNATLLCKSANKRLDNYYTCKQTKEYFEALKSIPEFQGLDLITSNIGGNHSGTWADNC